jgi:hypothetical protein
MVPRNYMILYVNETIIWLTPLKEVICYCKSKTSKSFVRFPPNFVEFKIMMCELCSIKDFIVHWVLPLLCLFGLGNNSVCTHIRILQCTKFHELLINYIGEYAMTKCILNYLKISLETIQYALCHRKFSYMINQKFMKLCTWQDPNMKMCTLVGYHVLTYVVVYIHIEFNTRITSCSSWDTGENQLNYMN